MIPSEGEGAAGAGSGLLRCEQRGTHVHFDPAGPSREHGRRHAVEAAGAGASALGRIEQGSAAESVGKLGASAGKGRGAGSLLEADPEKFEHQRSCPA